MGLKDDFCSITMVTFRKGAYERDRLARVSLISLLENTTYPFELNLIDNTQNNRGLGEARNLGLSLSSGKYIAIVDDDIEFMPGWLEACIEILQRFPNALATPVHVDKNRKWWRQFYLGTCEGYESHSRSGSNCMVMHRDTLERIGKFDNVHPSKDGVLFHDRINRLNISCFLTREPLAKDMAFNKHSYRGVTC